MVSDALLERQREPLVQLGFHECGGALVSPIGVLLEDGDVMLASDPTAVKDGRNQGLELGESVLRVVDMGFGLHEMLAYERQTEEYVHY